MKSLTYALVVTLVVPVWALQALAQPVAQPAAQGGPNASLPPEAKEEIILNNPANLQALKTLLGPELLQATTAQARPEQATNGRAPAPAVARVATPSPSSAAVSAGRQQTQVRPGETLDRVLARTLGATPFAPALVRKTVVEMNPTAFTGGSPHRLNAGATLVLPSLQDLQSVAAGGTVGALMPGAPGGGHSHSADDRRNWIRFP